MLLGVAVHVTDQTERERAIATNVGSFHDLTKEQSIELNLSAHFFVACGFCKSFSHITGEFHDWLQRCNVDKQNFIVLIA